MLNKLNFNSHYKVAIAELPNNPDSRAVSYDIMKCTLGPSLISGLWNNLLHYIHCDHHTVWCKCLTVQNFDEWIGVISDFDKENFDECFCLPVKCAILHLLLYCMPLLPLSPLLATFHTPQHMRTSYQINISKDQVNYLLVCWALFYLRRIGLKN